MSVAISIRLPEFTARRLEELAKTSQLSKTDLIVQGLEAIFASQLDRKITYLTDSQFDDVLNFLSEPTPKDINDRLSKTMAVPYLWEGKNE